MNLNGKTINPGDLRTSVTLQSRTVTVGDGGFPVPSWSTITTVWARWTNVHGSEMWAAQAVEAENAATVLIRYQAGLDRTCAVLKGSERFEIVSIDDIQERHEYMELKVKRMEAG